MLNNDILRRIRYVFSFSDDKMIKIFSFANLNVGRTKVCNWLKKDDHDDFEKIKDVEFAAFLNGLIVYKRGTIDDKAIINEKKLNNNMILRKLKIALNLKNEEVLDILEQSGFRLGKHELSAFFRNPSKSQYRECKDQVLRNFLNGMQDVYHKK